MKHNITTIAAVAAAMTLSACFPAAEVEDTATAVTFRLSVPAAETMTRAASGVAHIVIFDGDEKIAEQRRGAADFGQPTIALGKGRHTLRFVALSATADVDDATLTAPAADAFWLEHTCDVGNAKDDVVSLLLPRCTAKVVSERTAQVSLQAITAMDAISGDGIADKHQTAIIDKGEELLTFVPPSGYILTDEGQQVKVRRNTVTRLTDSGAETPDAKDGETLLCVTDTAAFYVAAYCAPSASLTAQPDPRAALPDGYRLPTRTEAALLHQYPLPAGYLPDDATRSLCIDTATGEYYTFLWGSGSVTKAGVKTKYLVKGIRTEAVAPLYATFGIEVDDEWSDNPIVQ